MPSRPEAADPYRILGLAPDADDEAVRRAFHDRVRAGTADAAVNGAYARVRDAAGRRKVRWTVPTSLVRVPPEADAAARAPDLKALAAELAFLSAWEAGAGA